MTEANVSTTPTWHALGAAAVKPVRAFFAKQRLDAEFVGETGDPAERIAERARTGRT